MSQFVFINNYGTALSAAINSSQTTITVTSSTGLPVLAPGQVLPLTLLDAATETVYEIVYVTGISGVTLTVIRGQELTAPSSYIAGDIVSCNPTAKSVPPVRSSLYYTASETLPSGNDIVAYPGSMTGNIVLTLPSTGMPVAGRIRVYGPATAYTTTVNLTNTTGSPFIILPDGSQIYSYVLPANEGQNFIDLFWSGYNWTAFNGGIMAIPNANAPNQPTALGQSITGGTLTNLLTSRSLGVTYTNTSSRPRVVYVSTSTSTAASQVSGYVNGITVSTLYQTDGGSTTPITMIVPPGATYSVSWSAGTGAIADWVEIL